MFNSLRSRLWISYALVIAAVLALAAGALLVFLARDNPQTNLKLRSALEEIARPGALPLRQPEQLLAYIQQADQQYAVRLLVFGPSRELIADSRQEGAAPIEKIPALPANALRNYPVRNYVDANGQRWAYTFRALPGGYIILAAAPRQVLGEIIQSNFSRDIFASLARAGGFALVLSLLIALLFSRWVAAPLQKMAAAARAAADGERRQVTLEGPREVRALGQAFNEMTAQVHASSQSQRDFVANVSHELRTPLTSIQGFAQAILDGTAGTPEAKVQAAGVIQTEAGRMYRMVVDLLDLAKLDAGEEVINRRPVDLQALLQSVVQNFSPQSREAQINLQVELAPLPSMIADGDRLAQVFTNLLDNAIKYTPSGGRVIVRARQVDGWVEVGVQDSGTGMPADEIGRVFERFYQLDKSRPGGRQRGVGLGLAIASEIVHLHGGYMEVNSQPGLGSEFKVRLPVSLPDDTTMGVKRAA
ncbi:MAG: HAMP domain-containing histidine kinase [Anaerolineae bacterium]|nr:HAMP domain-containing histidine kinase [Anaerolineae bacterium]